MLFICIFVLFKNYSFILLLYTLDRTLYVLFQLFHNKKRTFQNKNDINEFIQKFYNLKQEINYRKNHCLSLQASL